MPRPELLSGAKPAAYFSAKVNIFEYPPAEDAFGSCTGAMLLRCFNPEILVLSTIQRRVVGVVRRLAARVGLGLTAAAVFHPNVFHSSVPPFRRFLFGYNHSIAPENFDRFTGILTCR
jgi:hypothetical protein